MKTKSPMTFDYNIYFFNENNDGIEVVNFRRIDSEFVLLLKEIS